MAVERIDAVEQAAEAAPARPSAPPTPSSLTVTSARPSATRAFSRTEVARAYFAVFASASETTK